MKYFLKFLSLFILLAPIFAFAQGYNTLVGIPGVSATDNNFDAYLQAVYATSISLAALLAVIKIVIAGVKWMTTDIVSSKGDAKKDIEGAILGLVVILGAVLILYIINPNIGTVDLGLTPAPQPEYLNGEQAGESPDNEPTMIETYCALEQTDCIVRTCDLLGEYAMDLIIASTLTGAVGGAIAGTAIPVIGNGVVGIVGAGAGAAGAGYTAWRVTRALNNGECTLVCNWYDGQMTDEGCLMAVDADAYRQAELEAIRAAIAEENDCVSGTGYFVGDEYRCRIFLTDEETADIINALGVDVSPELQTSIIEALQLAFLTEEIITDSEIRDGFGQLIGGQTVLLIEVPSIEYSNGDIIQASNLSDVYTDALRVVEGICNSVREDSGNNGIGVDTGTYGGTRYISCLRP